MDTNVLFSPTGPGIHLLAIDPSPLADLIFAWNGQHPQWAIRRIRGQKCADAARLFDEFAAALQFPYYFGENWDAFWEVIIDLSWLWRPSFLVVVDRADQLLRESSRDFDTLIRILGDANEHWRGQQGDFDGELRPVAFQTLLACPTDSLPALAKRVEAAGTPAAYM